MLELHTAIVHGGKKTVQIHALRHDVIDPSHLRKDVVRDTRQILLILLLQQEVQMIRESLPGRGQMLEVVFVCR
ncbi:hypothetical protein D3C86_1776240 [compost metagenome]